MSDEFFRMRSSVSQKKKAQSSIRHTDLNVYPDFNFGKRLHAEKELPFYKKLKNQNDLRELNRFKREFDR